ncbi:L-alanine-DL-glutamate epimerase-like enolase superfamily enzyme [Diaminobutyricimonas aerilata]|uniref:L-alanine-DL-glutamate epimerase-like enolase superfamily enzyme n=1 Tax=Diaminobutyricimonas aerilata TaxID=1162967 RepID=A0A2M9CN73_9MICO|nr:mandelate racemase/muconate lactonizing enzyme family protein [Diaminobutyricimonas aerilata]PJJ73341.1 L-alanine-DL-glutamate epimerase-like enolase superfamily enzyme [Diaminobutyricimonas aerilata]
MSTHTRAGEHELRHAAAADGLIVSAEAWLSDVPVETVRTDAVQAFLKQETLFVRLRTASGVEGVGYSYTIGTGGPAVLSLLRETLLPALVGLDAMRPEAVWRAMFSTTRATTVGVLTALALAAVDTAVWDARSKAAGLPLWAAAGGARPSIPLYDTEGGWLHLSPEELVRQATASKERGMRGVKVKVGKPRVQEDADRLAALREAVGPDMDIMIDANQSMTGAEAVRRAAAFEPYDIFWFEEPLPAEDVSGHRALARSTSIPVAVGESMYSIGHFREYLQAQAASIVQVDVARIGGITPWLKVAHLAEAFNVQVAPHFLMELHVSLTCAVPNSLYLEHIPQLRAVTRSEMTVVDGEAVPSSEPGLGIDWDFDALDDLRVA